jgi:hypothetical protein
MRTTQLRADVFRKRNAVNREVYCIAGQFPQLSLRWLCAIAWIGLCGPVQDHWPTRLCDKMENAVFGTTLIEAFSYA